MRLLDRISSRLDERGVALPLALFGLIAASVMVTSALVTSSREVSISRAHQEGTHDLYAADDALEQFVAARAGAAITPSERLLGGDYDVAVDDDAYTVTVADLYESTATFLASGAYERREVYSLIAAQSDGRGRSVGALIETVRSATPITLDIDSGLTLGTNTTISGSAKVSNGSDAALCDSASALNAIRHSSDSEITRQGNGHSIIGGIQQDEREAAELMTDVLNGATIDQLASHAQIKFGPMYNQPAFSGSPVSTATASNYRWGCPAALVTGCTAAQSSYFPVVVIDANGGTVDITGTHGQGTLIIRNGHANIRGVFVYQGIVLIEGSLQIRGNPRIEGAVVAMGDETVIDPEDSTMSNGNPTIRFNKCQIVEAQRGLTSSSLDSSPQNINTPTFAWFEVIR
jgi:hypothetical protein